MDAFRDALTPTLSQGEREKDRAPGMHPDEWQARVQLAAAYRIFDQYKT